MTEKEPNTVNNKPEIETDESQALENFKMRIIDHAVTYINNDNFKQREKIRPELNLLHQELLNMQEYLLELERLDDVDFEKKYHQMSESNQREDILYKEKLIKNYENDINYADQWIPPEDDKFELGSIIKISYTESCQREIEGIGGGMINEPQLEIDGNKLKIQEIIELEEKIEDLKEEIREHQEQFDKFDEMFKEKDYDRWLWFNEFLDSLEKIEP